MDALIFKGDWQNKGGSFDLIDEMKEIAREIAPDWPQYSVTNTSWLGSNSRFLTPFEHPVCSYGSANDKPVFSVGKEIEGYPGVFELSFLQGVKPIIGSRSEPLPGEPDRILFKLDGFEEAGAE